MLLFFFLDVVKNLTDVGIPEFKNCSVIRAGYIFLNYQHLVTKVCILLVALTSMLHLHALLLLVLLLLLTLLLLHIRDLTV